MNARKTNTIRKSVENLEARDVPAQLATIQSISFGDGSSQRSMVREMTVNLTSPIEMTDSLANAFSLHRTQAGNETGPIGEVGVTVKSSGTTSSLVLNFSGDLLQAAGSVVDGYYDLVVDASQFDVNGDISGLTKSDDDYAFTIHGNLKNKMFRLAGDATGDGRVNRYDANAFSTSYLCQCLTFDFDGDGLVTQRDYDTFDGNYGVKL